MTIRNWERGGFCALHLSLFFTRAPEHECVVHGYISIDLREANELPFGGPEGLAKRTLGGESVASTGQISWKPDVASRLESASAS
jgi:hypothetical protein